ncbi:MAG: TSUP family transporter [Planctomycetota bacterium]|jgi:uncharacterized membrane protein YfcA
MDPQLAWLPAVAFAAAVLSGVFGMAGGMVLLAVLLEAMPVPVAMVLHGVTQATANGSRGWMLRRHVRGRVLGWYALGAVPALALLAWLGLVLERGPLLLLLGGLPLCGALLPRLKASIEDASVAAGCGAFVAGAQVAAGASGPVLDMFFVHSGLDRRAVVGTKAVTQVVGHVAKTAHHGALLLAAGVALPGGPLLATMAGAALAGTAIGRALLERLDEGRFRRWSRVLIVVLSTGVLARGAAALLP